MKVLIDISKQDYELACKYPDHLFGSYSWAIKKGTVISDDKEVKAIPVLEGITIGDIIKSTFPTAVCNPSPNGRNMCVSVFTGEMVTEYFSLTMECWNSPYQLSLKKEAEDISEERE